MKETDMPCSIFECTERRRIRVVYQSKVRNLTTENYTNVCVSHASPENFPASWGVILSRKSLS
jgi:hypothetical protein